MNATALRRRLVEIGRRISARDLVIGSGGNISARLGDRVYIKASGLAFDEMRPSDYIGLRLSDGAVLDEKRRPSSEFHMHLECYRRRPDIRAVVHTHPTFATGVGAAGQRLGALYPDFVCFLGTDVPTLPYVVPGGAELAAVVAEAIATHNAALLTNHGVVAVGTSPDEAFYRTVLIEEASKSLVAAKVLGGVRFLTDEEVGTLHRLEAGHYRLGVFRERVAQRARKKR